jgi:hypothetical protein
VVHSASEPDSPVRMRMACSTGLTKDLAVADLVGLRGFDDRLDGGIHLIVVENDLDFHLGQKSTTYSAPR